MAAAWCLDPRESAAYAGHVAGTYFAAVADAAVDRLDPAPGERVLDVACGAGSVARQAAARGAHVLALDVSAPMLRAARRAGGEVGWLRADAHALPFRDASFARASCPHGLMFFDAPSEAMGELARVVRPGGVVVATTWGPARANPHERALADAWAAHAREPSPFFEALFSLSDAHRVRSLARAGGLVDPRVERVRAEAVFPSAQSYWHGLAWGRPLGRALRRLPRATVASIRDEAIARMKPYAAERGYRAPMEALLLVARTPEAIA